MMSKRKMASTSRLSTKLIEPLKMLSEKKAISNGVTNAVKKSATIVTRSQMRTKRERGSMVRRLMLIRRLRTTSTSLLKLSGSLPELPRP